MKIQLQIDHLLGLDQEDHLPISALAKEMKITRHQLKHLLNSRSPQIKRRILEAACEYLLGHGLITRRDMFQQLFVVEPDSFWPMLAARQRVNFVIGVRWSEELGVNQQVVAADAVLQSVMVNRLTGVAAEGGGEQLPEERHVQQVIDSQLAVCWGAVGATPAEIQQEANDLFKKCMRGQNDTATICVGSIKSNPVTDHVIGHVYRDARAFQSEDQAACNDDRSCPFVMIYRKHDPQPESCWGGRRLSKRDARKDAGIYYATEPGQWDYAPCNELEDVALVFYRFHESRRNLEMVLGGFSGRSTRCLAEMLREGKAEKFWPPAVETNKLKAGVFIVKLQFRPRRTNESFRVRPHELLIDSQVISLPKEVMKRRLASPRD